MSEISKTCSNCKTKYTIEWNEDKVDLTPLTCPFCGYEVENEDDEEADEKSDDSWN